MNTSEKIYPEPNPQLSKTLMRFSYVVSGVVLVLVVMMRSVKIDIGVDFSYMPAVSAFLNTLVSICLILALYFVRIKNITYHRNFIISALVFSALFLVCYVLYHFTTVETRFCKEGMVKIIYLVILFSHILLAAVSLPFILITFARGISFQVAEHRKLARWVYPIWLYVAITGPICYLMLKPCYI
jgi:putative membrane protein